MVALPSDDLAAILEATASLWAEMRGQRLFLTGGTGFFGTWLTESFLQVNDALALDARLTVLTRDPAAFIRKCPHLAGQHALTLLRGDVRSFDFPAEAHTHIVHAATEASARQLAEQPGEMLDTMVAGTARVLDFAAYTGAGKLLVTSSGAVYGAQPSTLTHIGEDFPPAPTSVYGEGKRASESMAARAAGPQMEVKIARCFAFLGPHLPLDTHFAAGNFVADALAQRPIRIASDGTTVRSYLYAADLTTWLWTILFRGESLRAYNVGSEVAVSIAELASHAAMLATPRVPVHVAGTPDPGAAPARYVPSTQRARTELGLEQSVPLDDALRRTFAWHQLKSE